jgi:hypothetical protein
MKKILEVLRLKHEAQLSHEKIARACGPSKGVISNREACSKQRHG